MTRQPDQKPPTVYDYRRYIALVQFIATAPNEAQVIAFCEGWQVEPQIRYYENYPQWDRWNWDKYLDFEETFIALAQAVIKHHHKTEE